MATSRLALRARDGRDEDYAALYERVAPSLYAWIQLRLVPSSRRACEPADVLQEIWWRSWRAFATWDPERASFRAWMFGIGKHVLLELARDASRLPRSAERGASGNALASFQDSISNISAVVARDDGVRRFLDEAARLDPIDRALLEHCGLEDMTCEQAARQLGIGREMAAKRWQRLRARLREGGWERLLDPEVNDARD